MGKASKYNDGKADKSQKDSNKSWKMFAKSKLVNVRSALAWF